MRMYEQGLKQLIIGPVVIDLLKLLVKAHSLVLNWNLLLKLFVSIVFKHLDVVYCLQE